MAAAFSGAGQVPGLQVWRIEKLKPVVVEPNDRFFSGDAYVLLHTKAQGSALRHHIHFWIGAKCSNDEAASAAMLASMLDDALGARGHEAGISRQAQGGESGAFLSLFPDGFRPREGGIAGGLQTPDRDGPPALYKVSGLHRFQVRSVPLHSDSVTDKAAMVLSLPRDGLVIVYSPEQASKALHFRALQLARELKEEDAGVAQVVVVEQQDPTTFSGQASKFFDALGVSDPASFRPRAAAPADAAPSHAAKWWTVAYKVDGDDAFAGWPHTGALGERQQRSYTSAHAGRPVSSKEVQEMDGALTARALTADSLLLVHAKGTLYAWMGRYIPRELRGDAFGIAEDVRTSEGVADDTHIEIVKQGLEDPTFRDCFSDWEAVQREAVARCKAAAAGGQREGKAGSQVGDDEDPLLADAAAMARAARAPEAPVDDGSGKKKVWRIEKFELADVPEEEYGTFYAGDSYLVLYTYGSDTAPRHILYMWQGASSTQDERGACALQAVKVDDEVCGGAASQVRLVHGKESAHFVSLWGGRLVVLFGGVASGFRSLHETGSDPDGTSTRLFHVKGDDVVPPYAVEVQPAAQALNSDAEQSSADGVARTLLASAGERPLDSVAEGSESDDFWAALGGRGEYPREGEVSLRCTPRLFHLSPAAAGDDGGLAPDEVHHFSQADLVSGDVFLLDTHAAITLWLGTGTAEAERAQAHELASRYLHATGRSDDIPVTLVKEGSEPPDFTAHFHGWNPSLKRASPADVDARIAELRAELGPPPEGEPAPEWATQGAASEASTVGTAAVAPVERHMDGEGHAAKSDTAGEAPESETQAIRQEEAAGATPVVEGEPLGSGEAARQENGHAAGEAKENAAGEAKENAAGEAKENTAGEAKENEPSKWAASTPPAQGNRRLYTSELPAGGPLTPSTVRGGNNFEPLDVDPSGTRGVELKHAPGEAEFDLEVLRTMKGSDGIDPTRKELYLADTVFQDVFGMSKDAFANLKLWRQQDMKKRHQLF